MDFKSRDPWHQKTRVCGLSYGVVYVILRLAFLLQYRLVTDGQKDEQMNRHSTNRQRDTVKTLRRKNCYTKTIKVHCMHTSYSFITHLSIS